MLERLARCTRARARTSRSASSTPRRGRSRGRARRSRSCRPRDGPFMTPLTRSCPAAATSRRGRASLRGALLADVADAGGCRARGGPGCPARTRASGACCTVCTRILGGETPLRRRRRRLGSFDERQRRRCPRACGRRPGSRRRRPSRRPRRTAGTRTRRCAPIRCSAAPIRSIASAHRLLEHHVAVEDDVDLAALLERDPLPVRRAWPGRRGRCGRASSTRRSTPTTAPAPAVIERVDLLLALGYEQRERPGSRGSRRTRGWMSSDILPPGGDQVLARPAVLDRRGVGPVDEPRRLAGDDAVDREHERRDDLLRCGRSRAARARTSARR